MLAEDGLTCHLNRGHVMRNGRTKELWGLGTEEAMSDKKGAGTTKEQKAQPQARTFEETWRKMG